MEEGTLFEPEKIQSPFDAIKEVDGEGREWRNSRKLARLMGYQKYWNFARLMEKVATVLAIHNSISFLNGMERGVCYIGEGCLLGEITLNGSSRRRLERKQLNN